MSIDKDPASFDVSQIRNKEFAKTLWGYQPKEVVPFLLQLAKFLENVLVERKKQLEQINRLIAELNEWKNKEKEIEQLKIMAEAEAEEIQKRVTAEAEQMLEQAKIRAAKIRNHTETWLEQLLVQLNHAEQHRLSHRSGLKKQLLEHYAMLDNDELFRSFEQELTQLLNAQPSAVAPANSSI